MPTNQLSANNAQKLRDLANKQITLAWWNKEVWIKNAQTILANTKNASGANALDIAKWQYKNWITSTTPTTPTTPTNISSTPTSTITTPSTNITTPPPTPITNTPNPNNITEANDNILQAQLDEKKRLEDEVKTNEKKLIQDQKDAEAKKVEDTKIAEDLLAQQDAINKTKETNVKLLESESNQIIEKQKQDNLNVLNEAKLKTEALNNERLASQDIANKLQKEADDKAVEQAKVDMDVAQQQANWAMWKLWITFSSYAVWQTQQIANKWALAIAQLKVTANNNQNIWTTYLNDIRQKTIDLETSYTQSINETINNSATAMLWVKESAYNAIDAINNNRLLNQKDKAEAINKITQQYRDDKSKSLTDFYVKTKEISQDHIDNATAISNQIQIWNKVQLDKLNQDVMNGNFSKMSALDKAKLEKQLWMSEWTIDLMIKAQTTKSIRESLQSAIGKDYLPSLDYINSLSTQVKWLMDTWMGLEEATNAIIWKALPQNADYQKAKEAKKSSIDQQKLDIEWAKIGIDKDKLSSENQKSLANYSFNVSKDENISPDERNKLIANYWNTISATNSATDKLWDKNIQCTEAASTIAKDLWVDIRFGYTTQSKLDAINKLWNNWNIPEVWWFFISNPLKNWVWHVGFVKTINPDWTLTIVDANWTSKDISKGWPITERKVKITPDMTFSKSIANQWNKSQEQADWENKESLKNQVKAINKEVPKWATIEQLKTILNENATKEWEKNEKIATKNIKAWISLNETDKKEMIKALWLSDMYNSMIKTTEDPSNKTEILKWLITWWLGRNLGESLAESFKTWENKISLQSKTNRILNERIKENNRKAKEFIKEARMRMSWEFSLWKDNTQKDDTQVMSIPDRARQNAQLKSLMEAKWYKVNDNNEFVAPDWTIIW